ncbi:MAG: helix-turn-helix transcriptional regulator [Bacteroidota bacterium]
MIETEQVLVLIGVVLILFFAVLLLSSKRYRSRPNQLLATAFIALALIILRINSLLENTFLESIFEVIRIEYLFSVFLYGYVFATLEKKISPTTYIILWTPFILFSLWYALAILTDELGSDYFEDWMEQVEPFEIYIVIIFNIAVLALTAITVKNSEMSGSLKNWIYVVSFGIIAILLSFLVLEFVELFFDTYFWSYLGICISLFFISITYIGVQRLHLTQERERIKNLPIKKKNSATHSKNNITQSHFERIKILMQEEELFRNPNLDREALAHKLGLSASSVTRILKEEGNVSFTDFINQYRVQLAKKMLSDPRFDIFSLEAIGKEVGFKSRSTFYGTFKKEVGMSPGTYKKE